MLKFSIFQSYVTRIVFAYSGGVLNDDILSGKGSTCFTAHYLCHSCLLLFIYDSDTIFNALLILFIMVSQQKFPMLDVVCINSNHETLGRN